MARRTITIDEKIDRQKQVVSKHGRLDGLVYAAGMSMSMPLQMFKPEKLKEELTHDYVAFRIPDDFILGYGLDYDQRGRGLKDVYTIMSE